MKLPVEGALMPTRVEQCGRPDGNTKTSCRRNVMTLIITTNIKNTKQVITTKAYNNNNVNGKEGNKDKLTMTW